MLTGLQLRKAYLNAESECCITEVADLMCCVFQVIVDELITNDY